MALHRSFGLSLAVLTILTGCASSGRRIATHPPTPVRSAADAPVTPPGSLSWAERRAEKHLVAGIAAYEAKRPDEAREEFALALRAFDAPGIEVEHDAHTHEAYARLLDRLARYDVDALAAVSREETPLEILSQVEFYFDRPNPEAEREIGEAMQSVPFDLPVQINEDVLAFVTYFRTRHRGSIEAGLARSGRYLSMMREVFRQEGVPQDLVYMALIESNYKPWALSRAKARGIWQFIPETGRRYGLRQSTWIDERSDPEKSTRAAARYLKDLHGMFDDWYLAMAAYNCGEQRIAREVASGERKTYWDLVRQSRLPRETMNYVPAIIAGMVISKNPEAFGVSVEPESPLRYDSVVLPVSTSFRMVAQKLQTSVDYLRELNPELRKGRTPPVPYPLKVPPGRGGNLVQDVLAMAIDEREGSVTYVIKKGDTLWKIARDHGVDMEELADWNDITVKSKLRVGAVMQVPVYARREQERTTATSRLADAGQVVAPRIDPAAGASAARGKRLNYRVRKGDTLYRIARRYKVSIERLAQWNEGVAKKDLRPGDVLTIYVE